jgi:hypothetical protein
MHLPTGVGLREIMTIFISALVLVNYRRFAKNLQNALNDFRGGKGGPPSHPLPANDASILNRRRSKKERSDQL